MEKVEEREGKLVDIFSLDTYTLLELFINLLSVKAWQDMGLRVDPRTKKISKNFERAEVAIDCIALMIDKLEPHISDSTEKSRLRSLLADLQINYVQQKELDKKTSQN
jgi:hypothetical protein